MIRTKKIFYCREYSTLVKLYSMSTDLPGVESVNELDWFLSYIKSALDRVYAIYDNGKIYSLFKINMLFIILILECILFIFFYNLICFKQFEWWKKCIFPVLDKYNFFDDGMKSYFLFQNFLLVPKFKLMIHWLKLISVN